ncbi:MAG TPA: response regulator [Alphaproteobacteria bacterium]
MDAAVEYRGAAILIVDDDPVLRPLMRAVLEEGAFTVSEAADGVEALALCDRNQYDLIVVDVIMPHMDGIELCRELRLRAGFAYVPILMATGLDDLPSITKAYQAGATDFISKPLNWVILQQRVRYMLRAGHAFGELRLNQARLVAAKDAAEAANRAKTEFLANMSHELRTPLNAIIGFSTILRDAAFGPLESRYRDYAMMINDSGTHLLAIINNILDIAQAEANRLVLKEDRVEIGQVVALSTNVIRDMAERAAIDCSIEIDDKLPMIRADGAKLSQILINLLSNAVKFTPTGGSIKLVVGRDPDGNLAFRIEDTGIGIPADKLRVAMEPFGQVEGGFARKYPGIGLGLPLTKRLVELHGGTMDIASEPGKGTVVTARFPQERFVA